MDELISAIYKITLEMKSLIDEENFEEFEKLLNDRYVLMNKLDALKTEHHSHQYSLEQKQLLEKTFQLNQCLIPVIKENIEETQTLLSQIKMNKQISKKYQPYMNQTNGAFIDSKK